MKRALVAIAVLVTATRAHAAPDDDAEAGVAAAPDDDAIAIDRAAAGGGAADGDGTADAADGAADGADGAADGADGTTDAATDAPVAGSEVDTRAPGMITAAAPVMSSVDDGAPRVTVHVEAAFAVLGNPRVLSTSFRGYAGAAFRLGPGAGTSTFVGLGAHVGAGVMHVDDARALSGAVELSYQTFGPELRAGLRFGDGGYVDSQLYAAFAPTVVHVDPRLRLDPVGGIGPGRGFRAAVGVTFADRYYRAVLHEMGTRDDDGHHSGEASVALLAPVMFEVEMERGGGSDRYGVSFGWGF